jgi:hypothetical protein
LVEGQPVVIGVVLSWADIEKYVVTASAGRNVEAVKVEVGI